VPATAASAPAIRFQRLHLALDPLGMGDRHVARGRRAQRPLDALEQPRAQRGLRRRQPARHRRLVHAQAAGRLDNVPPRATASR
jgi:hypothetical protein